LMAAAHGKDSEAAFEKMRSDRIAITPFSGASK